MTRKIEVDLVANTRPFNNAMDAAIGKVTGFKSRVTAMGGGILGKGLAIGAGVASFNLLASAIGAGVSKLDEMHQAFLDDEASQARLQAVLRNTTKDFEAATRSVEAFAAAKLDMGFDDAATRDSIGQLMGVVGGDVPKALEFADLAMDVSRAKNIDLATATDAVTKGYLGQGRALQALGIDLRGATGGAEILARTFQNVRGAQEAYAKTGAGKVAAANVKMQETMEKVGAAIDKVSQVVIPIMVTGLSALVDGAGAIIGAFETAARVLDEKFGPALATIGGIAQAVASPLALIADIGANIAGAIAGTGTTTGAGGAVGGTGTGGVTSQGGITVNRGINIGVPIHHSGGLVGGPPGSDQLIMAQAGERIVPTGQAAAGQTIIVNIASFIGSDRDIDRFSDRLAFRLRSTSLS